MATKNGTPRPPKSIRKHVRIKKAQLRRDLPAEEAAKAIRKLVRATHS